MTMILDLKPPKVRPPKQVAVPHFYDKPTFKKCVYWYLEDVLNIITKLPPFYRDHHPYRDVRDFKVWLHFTVNISLKRIKTWLSNPRNRILLDLLLDGLTIYNRTDKPGYSDRSFVAFKAQVDALVQQQQQGDTAPPQLINIIHKIEKVDKKETLESVYANQNNQ